MKTKVFIGWSGDRSHAVAIKLRDWLGNVIQNIEPFVSSEDIAKGKAWADEIRGQLADTKVGIFCLTKENVTQPWIMFEAGSISRALDEARVCCLRVNIETAEIQGPLTLFQDTALDDRSDMLKLVQSINASQEPNEQLDGGRLTAAFDKYWADLKEAVNETMASAPETRSEGNLVEEPGEREILNEILRYVRGFDRSPLESELRFYGRSRPSRGVKRMQLLSATLEYPLTVDVYMLAGKPNSFTVQGDLQQHSAAYQALREMIATGSLYAFVDKDMFVLIPEE